MEDLVLSCLESRVEENRNLYARFLVGPFLRGDALTVATALRRVLLSSVESIGITALYIQGITHEFSTIVGVRESVLELSLNFGAIVLSYDKTFYQKKSFFDKLQIGYLQVQGPKVIYANHLKLPVGVKLVDPTQYIATISREGFIALKFVIGKKNTFFHPNIGSEAHFGDQAKNLSIAREICKKNIAVAKKTCSYRNGSTINSFFKTKSYESSDFAFIKKDHDKIEDLWFDKKKTARKSSNSFFTNLVVSSGNKSTRSSEQLPISDLQKNLYGMRKKAKHPILRRSSTAQTHNRLRVCISLTDKPGFCASKHIRTKLNSILFSSSKSLHFSKKADKVSRISTNQRFSGAKPQSLHTNLLANQRFALVRRRRRFFEISPIASARRFVSSRLSKRQQQEESIKYQKNNLTTTDPRLSFVDKYHASLSKVETPSLNHSDSGIFLIKIPEKRFQNKNENPLCQKYLSLHCLNHNRYNTFGAAFRFCRFDVSGKKYKQVILLSARSKLWFATLWIPSIVDPGYSFVRVLQKNTLDRSGLLVFDKSRSWQKKELCYKQEHNCLPLRFARNTQNLSQSRYKKRNICKKPFESKIRSSNSHKSTVLPFLRNELERKLYTRKNGIEQEKLNFLSNSDTFKSNICLRNVIPLDLNLTPVLKVNFVVEIDDEVLYLNQKLRERIILEVWTNGSIDPRQAVHDSALRLLDIFASFRSIYQVKGI